MKQIQKMIFNFLLINFIVIVINANKSSNEVFVETKFGKLKGFQLDLDDDKTANIFLGIPYAKPPVSELRFEVIYKKMNVLNINIETSAC